MASDPAPNFDVEYAKQAAKMGLFTEVIEKRKNLKDNKAAIAILEKQIESGQAALVIVMDNHTKMERELFKRWEEGKAM